MHRVLEEERGDWEERQTLELRNRTKLLSRIQSRKIKEGEIKGKKIRKRMKRKKSKARRKREKEKKGKQGQHPDNSCEKSQFFFIHLNLPEFA